jgi:stress-induced morphogen
MIVNLFAESFTNTLISDEIINVSGVCQSCFLRFNDYDEHQMIANTIQNELIQLMEAKQLISLEEEDESLIHNIKQEEEVLEDEIDYEPFEAEEVFLDEEVVEAIEDDFPYEVVVDDTKENIKGKIMRQPTATPTVKKERANKSGEFVVVEMEGNQKMYQCDICMKCFKDKSKLRSHREIHTTERNVICPVSLLIAHLLLMSQVFFSQVCNKAFKTMNCLRNHKRLHVPDRTYYNCDQCDKKYTQKIQLKKHIEIVHMQKRDYVCNTCGASFGTNSVLKMHLLSHQDFRAEKCEVKS